MTDLAPIKSTYGAEDRRWMRDIHGLNNTYGGTLDGNLFSVAAFPDGLVPSGTAVAMVTATRLYGPYDPAANDGRQTASSGRAYHVLDSHKVTAGRYTSVALLDQGGVLENRLPTQATAAGRVDTAFKAALSRVRYTNG